MVDFVPRFKCCFIGDYGVGKTSFIRSVLGMSLEDIRTTLGIDFFTTSSTINDKRTCITLWDTAGAERYRSLMHSYIRDSDIVFVIYDSMDSEAMESVTRCFRDLEGLNPTVVAVIGTKTDLGMHTHDVHGTIQPWARQDWQIVTDTCSTKDVASTKHIFKRCMQLVVNGTNIKKEALKPVRLSSSKSRAKSCCT